MEYCAVCSVASVVSDSLSPYGLQPARFLCQWDSPDKNTGVGCHALLQGIFPTQRWTHISYVSCIGRWVLYHLCHLQWNIAQPLKGRKCYNIDEP